jgi:hypothetical protein
MMIRQIGIAGLALLMAVPGVALFGQAPAPIGAKPLAAGESPVSTEDDRFPAMRDNAARLQAIYEKTDLANMDEIDRLLKTRRCQIARIGGLLDRTMQSTRDWQEEDTIRWKKWAEVEQERVDGQRKTLAEMEADEQRASVQLEGETADREELLRKKANLDKSPKQTREIVAQIDSLILDIKDSEARLAEAKKQYDDVTAKVANMNASITARVIDMRQNIKRLEAFGLQQSAYYEKKREEAQEICNTKQPDSKRTVLPKSRPPQPLQPPLQPPQ